MKRRKFLSSASAGVAATGMTTAVSANEAQSRGRSDQRNPLDEVTTLSETEEKVFQTVSVRSDEYLTEVDKKTGAVKVKSLGEPERKNLGIKKENDDELVAYDETFNKQSAIDTMADVPDVIQRTEAYQREIGSCSAGCGAPHHVDGTSMQFHRYVADLATTAIVAAILAALAAAAAASGGTVGAAAAAFFGNSLVEIAVGIVASDLVGNSLTMAIWEWDVPFANKQMTSGAYGIGEWQPGPDDLNRFHARPGHGVRCPP